jgi:acetyl-CoA C-acetyltransferase
VIVAGGTESMSQAPHLLAGSRRGFKYGDTALIDSMAHDGLTDAYDQVSMGESTERHNAKLGIGRQEQDEFAARSHQLAAEAAKNGLLADEITPVAIPQRRGEPLVVSADEGVRADTTAESLARLKPAFSADGTITAGTASQISDGACAVVLMSAEAAAAAGATVLAEVGAHGVVAGPDNSLHSQPSRAIQRALDKAGLAVADLDLVEINEAFAAVAIQSMRDLGIDGDKVNVNGGAIAIGHPLGASGARIALHLILELRRRGGGLGAAALCGGGGQGDALLFRVPAVSQG